jgi:hypothetical protein
MRWFDDDTLCDNHAAGSRDVARKSKVLQRMKCVKKQ